MIVLKNEIVLMIEETSAALFFELVAVGIMNNFTIGAISLSILALLVGARGLYWWDKNFNQDSVNLVK